jgi:hypothetical protein
MSLWKTEEEELEFERPEPYGWFTVVFPKIDDRSTNLDVWFSVTSDWVNCEGLKRTFSCFTPSVKKKKGVPLAISPVFFFKDLMDAKRFEWRFNGELVNRDVQGT